MDENVGSNGRLYFTYGKGAQFLIYDRTASGDRGKLISYAMIVACELSAEESEIYTYVIGRADEKGTPREKRERKDRFEAYLKMGHAEQREAGEAVELPLTWQEVKLYFSAKKRRRKEAQRRAEKILIGEPEKDSRGKIKKDKKGKEIWEGGTEEYRDLLREQELIEAQIAKKIGSLEQVPVATSARYREICERRKEIIEEQGIPFQLYLPEVICPLCNNTGINKFDGVCDCAKAKESEIKSFCAAERLKKRFKEEWANFEPSDDNTEEEEPTELSEEGGEA